MFIGIHMPDLFVMWVLIFCVCVVGGGWVLIFFFCFCVVWEQIFSHGVKEAAVCNRVKFILLLYDTDTKKS